MARLTLLSDLDCKVYIDTEYHGIAKANTDYFINLSDGAYWVECISVECGLDVFSFDIRIDEYYCRQYRHCVAIKAIRYNRLVQTYDRIGDEINGFIPVLKNGSPGYINTLGDYVFDYIYSSDALNKIVVLNGKFGIVDTLGNFITDCQYDYISSFKNNIAKYIKDKKFGLITSSGDEIITPSYTWIASFNENGIAIVQKETKYGVINLDGRELLSPIYDKIVFSERFIYVYTNYKVGLYTLAGECIITPQYTKIEESGYYFLAYHHKNATCVDIYNHNGGLIICNINYNTAYKPLTPSLFSCKIGDSWVIYKENNQVDFGERKITEYIKINNESVFAKINEVWHYIELDTGRLNSISGISSIRDCFNLTERFTLIDADNKKYLYDCHLNYIILIEQDIFNWRNLSNIHNIGRDYLKSHKNCIIYGLDKEKLHIYFNEQEVRIINEFSDDIINIGGHYKRGEYDRDLGWQYYFEGGKWGWKKSNGTLSNVIYDNVEYLCKDKSLLRVSINGKVGVVDCDENTILPIEYDSICQISYSSYRNNTKYQLLKKGKYAIANSLCRKITPLKYEKVCEYGGKMNGRWCIINDTGHEQSDFIYDYISDCYGDSILVKINNRYGVVGSDGQTFLPIEYDNIHICGHELLKVERNSRVGIISKKGDVILPIKYNEISVYKDAYIVEYDGKSILCDTNGTELFTSKTKGIKSLSGGDLFSVLSNGQYGIYSIIDCRLILDCIYDKIEVRGDQIWAFSEEWHIRLDSKGNIIKRENRHLLDLLVSIDNRFYTFVNKGGRKDRCLDVIEGGLWGCVDDLGTLLIPYKYEYIGRNSYRGLDCAGPFKGMRVGVGGKYGYIDKNLKEVIPVIYDDCFVASDNLIAVCVDGKWGYVDYANNILLKTEYTFVGKFHGSLAVIKTDKGNGIVDKQCSIVHPCEYGEILFREFCGYSKRGNSIYKDLLIPYAVLGTTYDTNGEEKEIRAYFGINGEVYDFVARDKYARKNGKWCILNKLTPTTPFLYDTIYKDSQDNLVHCRIADKHGVVDIQGEVIIPFIYDSIEIINRYSIIVKIGNNKRYINLMGVLEDEYIEEYSRDYEYLMSDDDMYRAAFENMPEMEWNID